MNYKDYQNETKGTAYRFLDLKTDDSVDEIYSSDNDSNNEEFIFSHDFFISLEAPIEKIRYFCIYNIMNIELFNSIIDEIKSYLNDAFKKETIVAIKALICMTSYNFFLSIDDFADLFTEFQLFDANFLFDVSHLYLCYANNYKNALPQSIIDTIFVNSMQLINNDKIKIWKIISKLISTFGYIINPDIILQNINFELISFIEKETLIQLFTSMFLSNNFQNVTNFFTIYDQCKEHIILIFNDFAEINSILMIDLILLIRQVAAPVFDTNLENIYEKYIKYYSEKNE